MKKTTGKPTVLIAEGIEFSRKILRMLLRAEYNVVEASDGAAAMRLLSEKPAGFACLLLDVRLSAPDGGRLLDQLQAVGLTDRIPVIALVAPASAASHVGCYEAGAVDVIEKPYREETLLYKLRWDIARFRGKCPEAPVPPGDAVARGLRDGFVKALKECRARLRAQAGSPDFMAVRDIARDLRGLVAAAVVPDLADESEQLTAAAKAENGKAVRVGICRTDALCAAYGA